MSDDRPPRRLRFALSGVRHELSREVVDGRLRGVPPEPVRKLAVRVNDIWYPVMQAFEIVTGVPRGHFTSHTARRHFAGLGYEVHGEIEARTTSKPPTFDGTRTESAVPETAHPRLARGHDESWHTEANVQAAVVTELAGAGWRILSVANTATKERGIDVVASRGDEHIGIEVKGFPGRTYADPARAQESKPTVPSTQAGHWYAQAILSAMRLRSKRPDLRSVIALPDFPRYRDLYRETRQSLDAAQITVWWLHEDGTLEN